MNINLVLFNFFIFSILLLSHTEKCLSSVIGQAEFEKVRYRLMSAGNEPYCPFVATGLSGTERGHTWTDGNLATFIIPSQLENKRCSHISFNVLTALVANDYSQTVTLAVNKHVIKTVNFTTHAPNQTIEVPLPSLNAVPTIIDFFLPQACTPSQIDPKNSDPRKLALALSSVDVIFEKAALNVVNMGAAQVYPFNLRQGFAEGEGRHRWLTGRRAHFSIPCIYDGKRISQITFDTFGLVSADSYNLTQKLIVTGNAIQRYEYTYNKDTPSHKVTIDVPLSFSDQLDIYFDMPNACLPRVLDPNNADGRELSIAFRTADLSYFKAPIPWQKDIHIGQYITRVANHVAIVGADRLKTIAQGMGSKVIVIDDGIDSRHNMLANNLCVHNTGDNYPNNHGTHVSGIVKTIAPQAQLEFISAYNPTKSQLTSEKIIVALRQAAQDTGDVVNLSLSLGCEHTHVSDIVIHDDIIEALEGVVKSGKVVMLSFGNDFNKQKQFKDYGRIYSRRYVEMVHNKRLMGRVRLVTNLAYEMNNEIMNESSNRAVIPCSLAISAPGTHIWSSLPGNKFGVLSGTSMAAPIMAGAYALLKSAIPGLTPDQYLSLLDQSARKYSRSGVQLDSSYGVGVVDVYAAYQLHQLTR